MYARNQTRLGRRSLSGCVVDTEGCAPARIPREPVVRRSSLKAAIAQLHAIAESNAGRSSSQALAANLVLLRDLGVEEEALDLVVEMALAHDVDEGMMTALNYLASGFLLALLTIREEGALSCRCGRPS
jgi:hypothetical protein